MKSKKSKTSVNLAAKAMAQRSVDARKKKWGKREFVKKMRAWGKLGGRPKKSDSKTKGTK